MFESQKIDNNMAIGFVVYHPTPIFIERLDTILRYGYDVYLFDNTPYLSEVRDRLRTYKNAIYFTAGKNLGLGIGMSVICSQAFYNHKRSIIIFDQDTIFIDKTLSFIEYVCKNNNWEILDKYIAINFTSKNNSNKFKEEYELVDMIINSGSMFNLEKLKNIGWFNEKYFVDGVDYDFCLTAKIKGYNIARYFSTPGIDHETEQGNKSYTVFGKKYLMRKYNFNRIYDVITSYLKIASRSLFYGEYLYFTNLVSFFVYYIIVQCYVRIYELYSKLFYKLEN